MKLTEKLILPTNPISYFNENYQNFVIGVQASYFIDRQMVDMDRIYTSTSLHDAGDFDSITFQLPAAQANLNFCWNSNQIVSVFGGTQIGLEKSGLSGFDLLAGAGVRRTFPLVSGSAGASIGFTYAKYDLTGLSIVDQVPPLFSMGSITGDTTLIDENRSSPILSMNVSGNIHTVKEYLFLTYGLKIDALILRLIDKSYEGNRLKRNEFIFGFSPYIGKKLGGWAFLMGCTSHSLVRNGSNQIDITVQPMVRIEYLIAQK